MPPSVLLVVACCADFNLSSNEGHLQLNAEFLGIGPGTVDLVDLPA
jgi:hypothetical protein